MSIYDLIPSAGAVGLHDPLTGLPNKVLLEDRLATLAMQAERTNTMLGVLFIDLDRFAQVNGRYGHRVGDRLLVELTRRASSYPHLVDTIARVGGDEFVALVGSVADDAELDRAARGLGDALNAPVRDPEFGEIAVRASIGVAAARPADVMPSTLLVLADRACREAKGSPDEPICWSRVRGLAALVDDDGPMPIEVHYRPLLEGRAVIGQDALARLAESDHTLIRAEELLHGTQPVGRLPELDLTMLRTSRRDADPATIPSVSVNVSVETLRDEDAITEIEALLTDASVDVTFDVAECELRSDDRVERGLDRLRAAGARIAVGEYGDGGAPVLDLIDVEIDEVKLHPRFAQMLSDGERSVPVIEALVLVCDRLGLNLVVKGVENTEQLVRLDALGTQRWHDDLTSNATLAGSPA